jgi:RNA recognition motif-containing protein
MLMNIYVGNLPFSTTEEELQDLFSQFGDIRRAQVITDRETGRSRGFGFVEMDDDDEAQAAITALNAQKYGGRPLTVNEARPKNERSGGGGGGGYRGGGYQRS